MGRERRDSSPVGWVGMLKMGNPGLLLGCSFPGYSFPKAIGAARRSMAAYIRAPGGDPSPLGNCSEVSISEKASIQCFSRYFCNSLS